MIVHFYLQVCLVITHVHSTPTICYVFHLCILNKFAYVFAYILWIYHLTVYFLLFTVKLSMCIWTLFFSGQCHWHLPNSCSKSVPWQANGWRGTSQTLIIWCTLTQWQVGEDYNSLSMVKIQSKPLNCWYSTEQTVIHDHSLPGKLCH